MDLAASLRLLDRKMRDHTPTSDRLSNLLAGAIREVEELSPVEVEVEASSGSKRIDIVVHPSSTGIEIKYHRPTPSGHNRPMTQQYGALLAYARKLVADESLNERFLVLLTDREGLNHISNKNLLPTAWDRDKPITPPKIRGLATTASTNATANGPWIDIAARLIWQARSAGPDRMTGLAWSIRPLALNS